MAKTAATSEIIIDTLDPMPGELVVEVEAITYSSATDTRPSMSWVETDAAGHVHAYNEKGELPTLVGQLVHIDCNDVHTGVLDDPDEPCEGYDVTEWHCAICDQEIKPQRLPDPGPKTMPGRRTWHVTVRPPKEITGKVTVWVRTGEVWHFGVAEARTESITLAAGDAPLIVTRLDGVSALGRR